MDLRADEKVWELCAFSTKQWQERVEEQCAGATAHRLSSPAPGCFFLTVSYKYSVLHDACWFQVVWDALEHLSSLSSCGFPTL